MSHDHCTSRLPAESQILRAAGSAWSAGAAQHDKPITRRHLLKFTGLGFGGLALQYLFGASQPRAASAAATGPRQTHFPPQVRSVIMLMQNGGPSQMDLFDPKPDLTRRAGQSMTVETFQTGNSDKLMASPMAFRHYGACGMEMAEILPHLGSVADDLCMVRSMVSEHNNHTEALVLLNTGKIFPGRPALGCWVTYALGTENDNLPAYIVLRDPEGYNTSGTLLWQNGWLPPTLRGTEIATKGTPVVNLRPTVPPPEAVQRVNMSFLAEMNRSYLDRYPDEAQLEARIHNYELAGRMQLAASDLLDLSRETDETRRLYGLDQKVTESYGLRCLMARRLVESGVRFVQVFPPVKPQFQPWDAHDDTKKQNEEICAKCDQPSGALIQDLKRRGLLESTLVIWSGEFGRLPVSQNGKGRDHNRHAFTLLLAGGSMRGGYVHGRTDEVGYRVIENPISISDLHATILYQLGLDHERLTYHYHGSEESLTDARVTQARVVTELFR